jgi:hypothetical protein
VQDVHCYRDDVKAHCHHTGCAPKDFALVSEDADLPDLESLLSEDDDFPDLESVSDGDHDNEESLNRCDAACVEEKRLIQEMIKWSLCQPHGQPDVSDHYFDF